jgi:hypothetical protein
MKTKEKDIMKAGQELLHKRIREIRTAEGLPTHSDACHRALELINNGLRFETLHGKPKKEQRELQTS